MGSGGWWSKAAAICGRALDFPAFAAAAFAFVVYLWFPKTVADPDLWWHLRDVQEQLSRREWLHSDLYSATAAGAPWINHEWLAELPFYAGMRLGGAQGVLLVALLVTEATMLGMFYLALRRSGSVAAALVVSVAGAALATVSFGPRTLLFGWLCLVVELLLLERAREGRVRTWELPCLFAVWVNLHGSWIIGMVLLVGLIAVGATAKLWPREALPQSVGRKLSLALGLSVAALFVNPYGWRLVRYPLDLAFHQTLNTASVEEWHALDCGTARGKILLGALAPLFMLQVWKPRRWPLFDLLLVAIGAWSALRYSRFLFLAALLVMPVLAGRLRLPKFAPVGDAHGRRWLHGVVAAVLLAIALARFPGAAVLEVGGGDAPREALAVLRTLPAGARIFNEYAWGGYLEWNLPAMRMFIDPRADIFEYNGTFQQYLDAVQMRRPLEVLAAYRVQYVVFPRAAPLSYLLRHTAGWRVRYEDAEVNVLEAVR